MSEPAKRKRGRPKQELQGVIVTNVTAELPDEYAVERWYRGWWNLLAADEALVVKEQEAQVQS